MPRTRCHWAKDIDTRKHRPQRRARCTNSSSSQITEALVLTGILVSQPPRSKTTCHLHMANSHSSTRHTAPMGAQMRAHKRQQITRQLRMSASYRLSNNIRSLGQARQGLPLPRMRTRPTWLLSEVTQQVSPTTMPANMQTMLRVTTLVSLLVSSHRGHRSQWIPTINNLNRRTIDTRSLLVEEEPLGESHWPQRVKCNKYKYLLFIQNNCTLNATCTRMTSTEECTEQFLIRASSFLFSNNNKSNSFDFTWPQFPCQFRSLIGNMSTLARTKDKVGSSLRIWRASALSTCSLLVWAFILLCSIFWMSVTEELGESADKACWCCCCRFCRLLSLSKMMPTIKREY